MLAFITHTPADGINEKAVIQFLTSVTWSATLAIQVARQSVTGGVLEPCNVSVTMASTAGTGDVTLEVTKLKLNVSVDVLELVLSLQSSVLDPLVQPSPDKCAASPSGRLLLAPTRAAAEPGLWLLGYWKQKMHTC